MHLMPAHDNCLIGGIVTLIPLLASIGMYFFRIFSLFVYHVNCA